MSTVNKVLVGGFKCFVKSSEHLDNNLFRQTYYPEAFFSYQSNQFR